VVTLYSFEDPFSCATCCSTFSDSRHISLSFPPPGGLSINEHFDCFCGGGGRTQNSGAGQVSSALGAFAAHKMARTGAPVPELPGGGNLEPFFQTFVRFLFRHFSSISPAAANQNSENIKRNNICCL
jgi:hypothetical protein